MKQAGFEDQEFVGTTGFNTSPVTTGALFRARKTGLASPFLKRNFQRLRQSGKKSPSQDQKPVPHDPVNPALDEL
jgi:hypothetical protein